MVEIAQILVVYNQRAKNRTTKDPQLDATIASITTLQYSLFKKQVVLLPYGSTDVNCIIILRRSTRESLLIGLAVHWNRKS